MPRVLSQTFGVVGAIIEKGGKILLVRETTEKDKNKWNHPAGWIEVGEDPIETVKREVKEEAGLRFTPTHILGVYSLFRKDLKKEFNVTPHPIKIIFIGNISKKKTTRLSDDISETKWFLPKEIAKMDKNTLRDLDIKKMVKDYFAGKRYPLELLTHTISE